MIIDFTREELDALKTHIVAMEGENEFDAVGSALAKIVNVIKIDDEMQDFDCESCKL